jgi:hypothetical protein
MWRPRGGAATCHRVVALMCLLYREQDTPRIGSGTRGPCLALRRRLVNLQVVKVNLGSLCFVGDDHQRDVS